MLNSQKGSERASIPSVRFTQSNPANESQFENDAGANVHISSTGAEPPQQLARFVYASANVNKQTLRPKPALFFPERFLDRLETSVCSRDEASDERVWHLGSTVRTDKTFYGRVDFATSAAMDAGLTCEAAPMENFNEHAVLLGWADGEDSKEQWKLKAVQLCNRCPPMATQPTAPKAA
ncbi:hypothetical protein ACNI65_24790 [Roseateles sp. So40a]|uniref:hypothetical protein n=1 Tax=Roseateles sp. So40a TaxID=3400226 RepID=UPI003A842383